MAYLTPPPTGRKKRGVFNKRRQPTYYEDIYGQMNEDNMFARRPDRCDTESESESDHEISGAPLKRKALQQRTPKTLKRKRGVLDSGNDGQEDDQTSFVSEDEDEEELAQFKIAPKFNSKTSVSLPTLSPKKFGMFGGQNGSTKPVTTTLSGKKHRRIDTQSPEPAYIDEPASGRRIRRPASRRLLKQQLAEHDKSKKEALRAQRANDKAAKEAKKAEKAAQVEKNGKTAKGASKLHWKDVKRIVRANERKHGKKSKKAEAPNSPIVLIDNTGIDPGEYKRFD